MSLSEKDRALIGGVQASGYRVTLHEHGFVSLSNSALTALLQAAREEAYKEGWNDREGDLIAGVNRIMPEEASQGAGEPVAADGVLEKIGAVGRKPVISKHRATNYAHLRDTIAALDARDLRAEADTIVWLCWWRVIDQLREEFLVADAKEDAQARIAALEGALREAQGVLAMMVEPGAIQQTTVINAYAAAKTAEAKARSALNQGAGHD